MNLSSLPDTVPVLPVSGMILLPRAKLPLNIFEPRYMSMVEDSLGQGRLIGIIQPSSEDNKTLVPPLYQVGCAGRITSFSETEDGRFLINLLGVCRFSVAEEMPQSQGYRRVKSVWEAFLGDVGQQDDAQFDRPKLLSTMKSYFKVQDITADWNAVQGTSGETLVSSLSMICPFSASEKQALVEAPDLHSRANMLISLLEMAILTQSETDRARH